MLLEKFNGDTKWAFKHNRIIIRKGVTGGVTIYSRVAKCLGKIYEEWSRTCTHRQSGSCSD